METNIVVAIYTNTYGVMSIYAFFEKDLFQSYKTSRLTDTIIQKALDDVECYTKLLSWNTLSCKLPYTDKKTLQITKQGRVY